MPLEVDEPHIAFKQPISPSLSERPIVSLVRLVSSRLEYPMFYSWVQHHSMFARCSSSSPGGPCAAGARTSGRPVRVLMGGVQRPAPSQREPDAAQVGRAARQRALRSRRAHRAAWGYWALSPNLGAGTCNRLAGELEGQSASTEFVEHTLLYSFH